MTLAADLRFALLGPVRAWRGPASVDVGTPQQQAVLAMLLLRAGRPVDLDELVDGVWGVNPPRAAVGTVRTYTSRLRAGLNPPGLNLPDAGPPDAGDDGPALVTVGRGYALRVPDGALDVTAFEHQVAIAEAARQAGRLAEATAGLRSALRLFEGRPLSGVPGPHADAARDRLVERRLQVLRDRFELDLELGGHSQLVSELTELCREYPLREELRGLLMVALYRSGRPAEALGVYADTARLLAAEFGANPGPELATLHQRILRTDDTLAPRRSADGTVVPRPAQLPAGTADFTGRARQVTDLVDALGAEGPAVVVSAVAGIGGVGKTTLAVHVAHLAGHRFPDGQLYANLRGARADPADPAVVLAGFLRALGVADTAVPDSLDERAALYRSVLAGRRVLVLLDDARDVAQVRPLLPGSASCAVLVTSRSRLATLPATRRVDLDVLEPDEAVALLARIVGQERTSVERSAALAVAAACGFLPLAVRIIGARLATRPGWTIAAMAQRLADQRDRLTELRVDDLDVAASFRFGYQQLAPEQARAFRLLAGPDLPDFGAAAAGAILDRPEPATTDLLEHLVDLAMLESTGPGRYRYHDLLRLYARAQSADEDGPPGQTGVLARLVEHHLATARNAYRMVRPGHAISERLAETRFAGEPVPSRDAGLDWATREQAGILAVLDQVANTAPVDDGLVRMAADLILALDPVLEFGFLWGVLVRPARAVLALARAARDDRAWCRVGYMLGGALMQLGQQDEAEAVSSAAADAAGRVGDDAVLAEICTVRALVCSFRQEYPAGNEWLARAAEIAERSGSRWGKANALMCMATMRLHAEQLSAALAPCRQGLDIFQQLRDPFGEAYGLCVEGRVMRRLPDLDAAIRVLARSIELARVHRLPVVEVLGVVEMAGCHLDAGRWADALSWAEQGRAVAVRVSWERTEAESLAALGQALAGLDEPERAQVCLRQANQIADRLGMRHPAGVDELLDSETAND